MQTSSPHPLVEKVASLAFLFDKENPEDSPCAEAVASSTPEQALTTIEAELNKHPDDTEVRLWWIRCHLELATLPTTALSAPLDELFDRARDDRKLHQLASTTYLCAGESLRAKNQVRLSLLMFERAIILADTAEFLSHDELDALDKWFVELLEEEQQKAPLRRESKEYIESLQTRIEEANDRRSRRSSRAPNGEPSFESAPPQSRGTQFTSKSILEAAISEATQQQEFSGTDTGKKSTRRALGFFLVLGLLLLSLGAITYHSLRSFGPGSAASAGEFFLQLPDSSPLQVASLSELASLSSLDRIPRNLASVGNRIKNLDVGATREDGERKEDTEIPDSRPVDDGGLISINEGTDTEREAIPANRVPNSDPGKFAKTRVTQVGSSPRKAQVPTPTRTGADSETESRRDPYAEQSDAKALDGGPVRSYEVKRFDPPLLFKTLTATSVLATPSLLSKAMARLERDSHVHCTRKMGPWLEIVSLQGKIGYILAQDATPAPTP